MILIEKDIVEGRQPSEIDIYPNTLYLQFHTEVSTDHFFHIRSLCRYWAKVYNLEIENTYKIDNCTVILSLSSKNVEKYGRFYPLDSVHACKVDFSKRSLITLMKYGTRPRKDNTVAIEKCPVSLVKVTSYYDFKFIRLKFNRCLGNIQINKGTFNTQCENPGEGKMGFVVGMNRIIRETLFCLERQKNTSKYFIEVTV